MARSSRPLFQLYIQLLFVTLVSTTCYFPDGSEAKIDVPCTSDSGSFCCRFNDLCLSNGLCLGVGSQPYVLSRGTCTDRNWESGNCPQVCRGPKDGRSGGAAIINLKNGENPQYCCNGLSMQGDSLGCISGDKPFTIKDGKIIYERAALSGVSSPPATSSATSSISTGSPSTTSTTSGSMTATAAVTPSACPSSNVSDADWSQKVVAVGAGVGVPLGVLALLALGGMLFERRKRLQYIRAHENDFRGDAQAPKSDVKWFKPRFDRSGAAELSGGDVRRPELGT